MSLVAYGNSDSDASDSEDEQNDIEPVDNSRKGNAMPSGEKQFENNPTTVPKRSLLSGLPPPKAMTPKSIHHNEPASSSEGKFLSALPAPKRPAIAAAAGVGGANLEEEEEELEEEVKMKSSFLAGLPPPKKSGALKKSPVELEDDEAPRKRSGLQLPPPKTTAKARQAIKISVPSLPDDNSDDEDNQPERKRPRPSGLSGLLGALPAPKNSAMKQASKSLILENQPKRAPLPDAKKLNRPLIPHTLTKRPTPPTKTPVRTSGHAPKDKPVLVAGVSDDSEDDEEEEEDGGSNFFSLGDKKIDNTPTVSSTMDVKSTMKVPSSVTSTQVISSSQSETSMPMAPAMPGSTLPSQSQVDPIQGDPPAQDGPLQFQNSMQDAPLQFKASGNSGYGQSGATYGWSSSSSGYGYDAQSSSHSQGFQYSDPNQQAVEGEESAPVQDAAQMQQLMQDEQFLRMQGKNRRGKDDITFIEVSQDQQIDGTSIELTKGLSEEQDQWAHSRKKKDQPSTTSKRKHQITYLAFKAKEREFELKNQWAQNKATKRQTQSKYGF